MHTNLVGASFRSKDEQHIVRSLSIGDELRLVRDPTNGFDPNAIRVYYDAPTGESYHIGFIPKEDNRDLAQKLDDEIAHTCKVDSRSGPLKVGLEVLPAA